MRFLTLVLAVVAACTGCNRAPNGAILFFGQMPQPDNRIGFIISDATGSSLRYLTPASFTDGAVWSPDARRIAFSRNNNLWIIGADGSGLKQVTSDGKVFSDKPSWSPDGKRLAFTAIAPIANGQVTQIFTIGGDGSNRTQLTTDPNPSTEPSWSPNGSQMLYTYSNGDSEIYSMSAADGSGKVNLSNNQATLDISASWEHSGLAILYLRYTPSNDDERSDLYRMAPNGAAQTLIKSGADRLNVFSPMYSPDSSKIVFQGMAPRNSDPSYAVGIYTINNDGTGLHKLIDFGYSPDWGRGFDEPSSLKHLGCPPYCIQRQQTPRWDPGPLRVGVGGAVALRNRLSSRGKYHSPNRIEGVAEMSGEPELSFYDLVHQLNADEDAPRIVKAFEAQHGSSPESNSPVVHVQFEHAQLSRESLAGRRARRCSASNHKPQLAV